ncbi:hypothetical protein KGY79_11600 [Candidatus Bipolaricaulota bacterium]|nr:hypothetical protein [Candidatus Bipolaricaulota bacterium]
MSFGSYLIQGTLSILFTSIFLVVLIDPIKEFLSELYGPLLFAPLPEENNGVLHSLRLFTAPTLQLTAVYFSFGLLTSVSGGTVIALPIISFGDMGGENSYTFLLIWMLSGIIIVMGIRLFSLLQSTAPITWITFYLTIAISIFLPVLRFLSPGYIKTVTDKVFQMEGSIIDGSRVVSGLQRVEVIDRLIVPGLVLALIAVVVTELLARYALHSHLRTVPLSLFDEYRESFLLHEQKLSRKGVTNLYKERLDQVKEATPNESLEIRWVTYSATKGIVEKINDLVINNDVSCKIITLEDNCEDVRSSLSERAKKSIEIASVPKKRLPHPRFMTIGHQEVLSAMPVPPRDLKKPTDSPSNMGFLSRRPDCVARFRNVFDDVVEAHQLF